MKDERTAEEKYGAWVSAVTICHGRNWQCVGGWRFISPSGTIHDLSSADLTRLEYIEANGSFLVDK